MLYNNDNRGLIQHKRRARQINSFAGLRLNNITPTDIDGFIDYRNKAFIFLEVKYRNSPLSRGQKIALERLCDATYRGGLDSVLIIARHAVSSPGDQVDVGNLRVSEYRYKGIWRTQFKEITVKEAVEKFTKRSRNK